MQAFTANVHMQAHLLKWSFLMVPYLDKSAAVFFNQIPSPSLLSDLSKAKCTSSVVIKIQWMFLVLYSNCTWKKVDVWLVSLIRSILLVPDHTVNSRLIVNIFIYCCAQNSNFIDVVAVIFPSPRMWYPIGWYVLQYNLRKLSNPKGLENLTWESRNSNFLNFSRRLWSKVLQRLCSLND